ncbi:unnamed protein product [Orchesella dallaii]|uniref:Gustatory receptor n=1 Tax=Orchesella dallaii TaxID=48710 RepID=A0ABP1R341_9HEXA
MNIPQRIFIVEPFVEEKRSKLPLDFIEYPIERSSECSIITKQLYDLTMISIRASQHSGLFLFAIDKKLNFTFSWFSFPGILAIIRLLIVSLMTVFYWTFKEVLDKYYAKDLENEATLGVTELVLSGTIISSDAIGMILFLMNRKQIEDFLNRFLQSVIHFADELKNPDWISDWFRQASKRARWLVNGINFSAIFAISVNLYQEFFKIILFLVGKEEMGWFDLTLPLFSFLWFIILFRRLHFRIVLMTMIDTLQFGFLTVKEHVKELANEKIKAVGDVRISNAFGKIGSATREGLNGNVGNDITVIDYVRQVKLTKILEMYRRMESLLGDFNELYKYHMLIGIGSVLTVMLMALFHFLVKVNGEIDRDTLVFAIDAGLHIWVLCSLGTAATEMATEADACIIALREVPLGTIDLELKRRAKDCTLLLKEIPLKNLSRKDFVPSIGILMQFNKMLMDPLAIIPGLFFHVNRKTLTAISGAVTTYLVVLVQFLSDE